MEAKTFKTNEPEVGSYCDIVYIHKGNKYTEKGLEYRGEEKGSVHLRTNNWAGDFYVLKINQILFIGKLK